MKKIYAFILFILTIITNDSFSSTRDFIFSIKPYKDQCYIGEPVLIRVILTNNTDKISKICPAIEDRYSLIRFFYKKVNSDRYELIKYMANYSIIYVDQEILARESCIGTWNIYFNGDFVFKETGVYHLYAEYSSPDSTLVSNILEINIIQPPSNELKAKKLFHNKDVARFIGTKGFDTGDPYDTIVSSTISCLQLLLDKYPSSKYSEYAYYNVLLNKSYIKIKRTNNRFYRVIPNCDEVVNGFFNFINKYPNSFLLEEAEYHIYDAYIKSKEYDKALKFFDKCKIKNTNSVYSRRIKAINKLIFNYKYKDEKKDK